MKLQKILLFLAIIFLIGCTTKSTKHYLIAAEKLEAENNKIDFIVKNPIGKDSIIEFKVINKSSFTYVLPLIFFPEYEKVQYVLPAGEHSLFFLQYNLYDEENNFLNWTCYDCFPHHNEEEEKEITRLDDLWEEQKKNLDLTKLIILKPKETKTFKIPFSPVVKVTNRSIFKVADNDKVGNLYIQVCYFGENTTYPAAILSTLEKLAEKENYKIYTKKIISNKVMLNF